MLLGPVELRTHDGSVVHVGGARRRALLAALAMDVNRVVPVERLLDMVWDQAPPPSAKAVLQGHVASLRGMFDDTVRLVTREPGYVLQTDPNRIDAHHQRALLARADAAEDPTAVRLLRQALGQWRGPALADCGSAALREASVQGLESTRLRALEQLAERLLRAGQVQLVTAELSQALEAHPLRESLARLLMLALHREGRQAEALATYHGLRARLAEEAGVDPGGDLQAAFAEVLRGEGTGTGETATGNGAARQSHQGPLQLPREAGGFIGRGAELAWLDEHGSVRGGASGDGLLLVTGPAGVGKTALVLRWAHRFARTFPDGRLCVNLRGFDETEPLEPTEALAGLLRALGVADTAVPATLQDRIALYRTVLTDRRALIVLENARSTEQVLPLLPGEPGCVTVVTSRERLSGLVAQEGAAVLALDVLSAEEGLDVLARVAGRQRLEAEPEAAHRIVEMCERLPLALRIAGARVATRPSWSLGALAEELADEQSRLAALCASGPLSIEAALELTCRTLPEPTAQLFRLLGTHPGQQIDAHTAAALADTDLRTVRTGLLALDSAHLVQETVPGRYARHDLVRLYARQAAHDLPAAVRENARRRLLDYYLAATAAAALTARPSAGCHQPARPLPAGVPPFAGPVHALQWFRREEPTIRELVTLSAGWDLHRDGCRLADNAGFLYYDDGARLREWELTAGRALEAAEAAGTSGEWPRLHSDHGVALLEQGHHARAVSRFGRACLLADRSSDPALRHLLRNRLANGLVASGAPEQAVPQLDSALTAARELGDDRLIAQSLNNLANAWLRLDRPAAALEYAQESLRRLAGRTTDPFLVISTQTYAEALHGLGQADAALSQSRRALELGRAQGNLRVESYCAEFVGKVLFDQGRREEARAYWERALDLSAGQGRPVEGLKSRIEASCRR
ncbi:BTAD domain-containing putative transcriptional regulator [Kitasatospora sp. MAA4]|uniref:AfsR/SARP family transcriptional regulator n=1 Tax=Kitasatospora sp. MAA4 TaxID=3035093 RepID=UPI0024760C52|nr:BTAD domain-containing putative transcriptional regulator [Kitasatospora sp. MAA4]